jgi:hypothetical protein
MRACELRRQEMLAEAAHDRLATQACETTPAGTSPRQAGRPLSKTLATIALALLLKPRASVEFWPIIRGRTRPWRHIWS